MSEGMRKDGFWNDLKSGLFAMMVKEEGKGSPFFQTVKPLKNLWRGSM